jgi:hypothetical protein
MSSKYSKISLIQHPWDSTTARLLDILDYQTTCSDLDLTGKFLLLFLYLGCTTAVFTRLQDD